MNIIQVVILGIVEGITEFLPVSSTFHLIFTSNYLGLSQTDSTKLVEVVIQSGAIFSAVILYYKDVVKDKQLAKQILISFIPTAIIGLVLYKIIKTVFFTTPLLMVGVFIAMGIVFLVIEYLIQKGTLKVNRDVHTMTVKDALFIGVMQALAVVPGVSRAGAVMVGMMSIGYKREEAARYSFLLAIPTIMAASALDLIKMKDVIMVQTSLIPLLLIGLIVSFIVSYVVIKWFIKYLQTHSLQLFGWYRIILGIIVWFFH